LDDLGAEGYGPGGKGGVACVRGAIEVCYLEDDGCDDTGGGLSMGDEGGGLEVPEAGHEED